MLICPFVLALQYPAPVRKNNEKRNSLDHITIVVVVVAPAIYGEFGDRVCALALAILTLLRSMT